MARTKAAVAKNLTPGSEVAKPTKEKKNKGKAPPHNYNIYLHRILKQVHPEMRISKKGMGVMDSMMNDVFDRLSDESARLTKYGKSHTLLTRDVQAATRLVLPGELAKHAISEGTKAISKYSTSKGPEKK